MRDRYGEPVEERPEPPPYQPNHDLIGYIEAGQEPYVVWWKSWLNHCRQLLGVKND